MTDSINLIEKALKLRQYFPPYVCHYAELLIENNNLLKAKKYLYKSWCQFPHPDYKLLIKLLSIKMKVSYFQLADYITSNTRSLPQSRILMAESLIDKEKWIEAKNQLSSLLEHKPTKEVCLLMSIIETGETNDPQKLMLGCLDLILVNLTMYGFAVSVIFLKKNGHQFRKKDTLIPLFGKNRHH